nr:GntR family transcriptional regulator [Azospirillum sp. SYSU D00513]
MRDQIYLLVRRLILSGSLKPGAVVNEKLIAEQLGISRTPVREAVKRLSDEALITVVAQSSTYVSKVSLAQIEEAHVIRRALEIESIRRAAPRVTDDDLLRIEELHALYRLALDHRRYDEAVRYDDQFHRTISRISDMPGLWRAVEISKAQLDRCRHLTIPEPDRGAITVEQHGRVIDALRRRDPDEAAGALRAHLDSAYDFILHFLKGREDIETS